MSSTKVVGYFNNNRWPVIINISAVNVNMTISPKGYVVDRDTGKKVNDPLLEKYVGADMLSRESSKIEVPLVLFPRPIQMESGANRDSVGASSHVNKDSRGIVQDSSFDGVLARNTGVPSNVTAPSHAVATYSMEEAVKRRIFKPVIIPDDSRAPKETDGQPVRGDNLPPIMMARDATPAEARKLTEAGLIRVESPVEVKDSQAKIAPVVESDQHDEAEADATAPSLDVGAHLKQLQAQLDKPDTTPTAAVAAPQPAAPKSTTARPDKFVCAADGRSFKKKGYLLNHVKKHFADREKELMAPYANDAEE